MLDLQGDEFAPASGWEGDSGAVIAQAINTIRNDEAAAAQFTAQLRAIARHVLLLSANEAEVRVKEVAKSISLVLQAQKVNIDKVLTSLVFQQTGKHTFSVTPTTGKTLQETGPVINVDA